MTKRLLTPVLLVDDQKTALMVMTRLLESLGVKEIATAGDGLEALAVLEKQRFGLVISDWHMSPLGGLQLLRQMRSDPRFDRIPFIMTSIDPQMDLFLKARQAGADAVLLKPFTAGTLRVKIEDLARLEPGCATPFVASSLVERRVTPVADEAPAQAAS